MPLHQISSYKCKACTYKQAYHTYMSLCGNGSYAFSSTYIIQNAYGYFNIIIDFHPGIRCGSSPVLTDRENQYCKQRISYSGSRGLCLHTRGLRLEMFVANYVSRKIFRERVCRDLLKHVYEIFYGFIQKQNNFRGPKNI